MNGPARDFVGYGGRPPHPHWPNNARLALNIILNYEEGSELSALDGDGRNEAGLAEVTGNRVEPGERDLAFESMYEYGARAGFWRIHDVLQSRALPMTIFGCAAALERNPPAVAAIAAAGYDVCAHGWRWAEHFKMTAEEERAQIARAIRVLTDLFGERPLGWYCRYAPSVNTRRLLVEEGGFLYDSDAYNDDLPYWTNVSGQPHLVVPYTMDTNDARCAAPGHLGSGDEFYAYLRGAFDRLYAEGEHAPKMMSLGLHPRITGRPARADALARFLDYVLKHESVWICRRLDIANHWRRVHPASQSASQSAAQA